MDKIKEALPPITIVTTTYFPTEGGQVRANMASFCIKSWMNYIHYQGALRLHIADDGSGEHTVYPIDCPLATRDINPLNVHIPVTTSRQERMGAGTAMNVGFQEAFTKSALAMYLQDDVLLKQTIDLTPLAELLLENEDVGMIRLGLPHLDLTGKIAFYPSAVAFVPDRKGFVYSHRPALYHKRFFEAYGWFDDKHSAVESERKYNVRYCASEGPSIVMVFPNPWEHLFSMDLGELNP